MKIKVLTVWDQEDLHYVAEEVLIQLRNNSYWYDDEGNNILRQMTPEEQDAARRQAFEQCGIDYLDFRENEELHHIPFAKALEMPLETIREKYLKGVLSKARGIMRKGTMVYGYPVSDEVPDSYLDDLLALRWRENLKLWAIQWEKKRESGAK